MPHTKKFTNNSLAVSVQLIERRIYLIRGHKVMIDVDLAELYDVPTKRLNEQVRRNSKRFPVDFMFQLTKVEAEALRSQFATSRSGHGGRRSLPYAFTEQGVAMLSSVLNSDRAANSTTQTNRIQVRKKVLTACEQTNSLSTDYADLCGVRVDQLVDLLCATFVFSVSPVVRKDLQGFHHRGTENTEIARRKIP